MGKMDELLKLLKNDGGSDLHLAAGIEPRMRRSGSLAAIDGWPTLTGESIRELLREIASDEQWANFERESDLRDVSPT